MTTLNVGGRRVTVSDDFLKLPPEQQEATVEEISRSFQPETSTASDMLQSLGSGVRQGVEAATGAFGDVGKNQGRLASWLAGKLGASPETQATVGKVASWLTPYPAMPTTEQIQSVDEKTIGKPYEPQTIPGEYTRTVGEFLPGAVVGPGGPVAKAAQTIIPAVVSETAGQLTKGTPYEKYARAAAALVAGAPTAFFGNIGGKGQAVARAVEGSTPDQIDKAERLFQDAQAGGTPITRFEALQQVTNGGTRAGDVQRIVEGKGELRDFFAPRPQQVEDATRGQFDQISPVAAQPSTIGPAVGKEAEGFVNDVRGKINRATEPLYAAAGPQRVDPATFQRIQSAPGWEEASNAIRNDPQLARYVSGLPDDSVGFLNEVQKYLKGQSENAAGSINAQRNMQRSAGYGADASTVRQAAEQASPEFAQAVQTQADLRQRYLDPLMQGPIGKLADKDITTRKAIDALFPRNPLPNSEREISMAVGQLAKRNPAAAKQLVRAHVESAFNQAVKELQSGANQFGGAGFVAAVKGNPQQAKNLEAAIRALPDGDGLWDGFSRYLDILQAQGTRQRIGSQTAFNEKLMEDLSQGSPLGTAASIAAGGGLSWPRKALETAERWRLGRNVEEIAKLITDPRAGKAFRSLATAKGSRARNIAASLTLMGSSGRSSLPSSE